MSAALKPILVFGYGNPSRGDDALGPAFVEAIEALALDHVDCLTDFQLQVEHALDLQGRQQVVFVDASSTLAQPFAITEVIPDRDNTFTTHAISPAAVLQAFQQIEHKAPPPTFLLAIRGETFVLGEPMSASAHAALREALTWFKQAFLDD